MKYRPSYPGAFETIDQARAYVNWYVPWYNQNHKHSGIALFSPEDHLCRSPRIPLLMAHE